MKTLGGALLEKFLPYGTYLALILAFMFNIGYFAPIDIRLFTLFSLSEHLLFSIEAIPIAFLVFILGAMLYYYSHLLVKKFNFRIWIARIIIIASFALLYFASLLFFNKAQIREQYSIVILSVRPKSS